MKKEYIANIMLRLPRPRSKRRRENGTGANGAAVIVASGGSTSEPAAGVSGSHSHANKADLDQLTTDTLGYVHVSRLAEVADPVSGEVTVEEVTEKVKAGLADLATDLAADSPANKRFLSRLADDIAEGFLTLRKGLRSVAKAFFDAGAEFGQFVSGSSGARVDSQGNAEVETLTARKSITSKQLTADSAQVNTSMNFGAPMVAGVSGGGVWVDALGNVHLQVDFAEVTKKATFAEAEVKKLRHVGGVIILSPASMECTAVEVTAEGYKCYFRTESPDYPNKKVSNEFAVGDLARCQTCNLREGTTSDAANRYYWRRVVGVGEDYIVLSETDCDPAAVNDAPAPGDSIIQLGNSVDPARQNPIIIAAYGGGSPYIYQFMGIDDYVLPDRKAVTKISPSGNRFTGDFLLQAGDGSGTPQAVRDFIIDHSRVYRLVAKAETSGADAEVSTALCRAYSIEQGEMVPLRFSAPEGLLSFGDGLLCVGDGLLVNGEASTAQLLTLTYTAYILDANGNPVVDPEVVGVVYDGETPIALRDQWTRIDFTLWVNGAHAGEASVQGPLPQSLTRARLEVLGNSITSEVEERKNSVRVLNSLITQNAEAITQRVTLSDYNADMGANETRFSQIEQTAEAVSLRVGQVSDATYGNLAHNTSPLYDARTYRAYASLATGTWDIPFSDIYADSLTGDDTVTLSFQYSIKSGLAANTALAADEWILVYLEFDGTKIAARKFIKERGKTDISTNYGQCINGSFSATISLSAFSTLTSAGRITAGIESSNGVKMERAYISALRVNRGSKALPWAPNPLDAEQMLNDTGIDIRQRQITLTADNVRILNNAGRETASFDSDGEFCAHRVIARNSDGTIVAAMNASGRGEYTMYYPDGKRKMELMPSEDRDQALIFYDRDGETPLWTLGASGFAWQVEQHFEKVPGYLLGMTSAEARSRDSFQGSSPLFRFVASEASPNADYNGLYYVKDIITDLTEERAHGRYYAAEPIKRRDDDYIRYYMEFDNGVRTASDYINCN